jgi:site-specific DNA-adenine methylase
MKLRKSFLDIIQDLTPNLYNDIIKNIDELTDHLTNTISNDELKLCNEKTYEREVHSKIQESNKFILKTIFNYNG